MSEVKPEPRALPRPGPFAQTRYLRRLFAEPQPVLEELRDRYGPVVGLGAGPARLAVVGDPTAIADMFAEPTESFRWNHKFNVLGFVVGKGSMIVSDGDDHRRRRGAVQAGFSRRRLNSWIPMIVDGTDAAIAGLVASLDEPGQTADMYPVGRSLVLEITIRALCGERLAERAAEIGDLFQRPQDYLEAPAIKQLPHPFPFGARAQVKRDRQAFDAIIDDEIARLRSHPDGDDRNVLETLVTTGDLSDAEIRDQINTLIGAGYDTTAATLAWLLLRAAATPDLWERLRAEADTVFGALNQPDHTSLAGLDLAARTVHESLRLHPAGVVGVRETTTAVSAGGYLIPRRTLIAWSPHLAGQDPHHWPNPLSFDPDRHLDPTPQQAALAKAAWVPFGGGARNCIGFALAQIELTLIVARLAQRLDLNPTNTTIPPAVGMVVNRPQGGAPIHVTLRHST
jgi:cytochrome P450